MFTESCLSADSRNCVDANFYRPLAGKVKGMQLGRKSKTTDMFEKVRGDIGGDDQTPLVTPSHIPDAVSEQAEQRMSSAIDRDVIHVVISETVGAKISRDGTVKSINVSGDLNLRVLDASLTRVRLGLKADTSHGAQFRTHPQIDRAVWNASKTIQLNPSAQAKGFPVDNPVAVLRWKATPRSDDAGMCPISFTIWINEAPSMRNITIEYELTGSDALRDVVVSIPYQTSPSIKSPDATFEIDADTLEWVIGDLDESNGHGSFEFESYTEDEEDFFPMNVRFSKTTPFVNVDVSYCHLITICYYYLADT